MIRTMAEIVELRPAGDGERPSFQCRVDMEGDLKAIDEFADALALVERHQSPSLGNQAPRPSPRVTPF